MDEKGQISGGAVNGVITVGIALVTAGIVTFIFNQVALAGNVGTITLLNTTAQTLLPIIVFTIAAVVVLGTLFLLARK